VWLWVVLLRSFSLRACFSYGSPFWVCTQIIDNVDFNKINNSVAKKGISKAAEIFDLDEPPFVVITRRDKMPLSVLVITTSGGCLSRSVSGPVCGAQFLRPVLAKNYFKLGILLSSISNY